MVELVRESKVSFLKHMVGGIGAEDEDDRLKSVGGRGDRLHPDPTIDLRTRGVKSKFWATMMNDEDSDEEVVPQSPLTPDLVRHAAVHGFTKDQLYEAELALQN